MTMKIAALVFVLVCAEAFVVQHSSSNKLSTLTSLDANKGGESWGKIAATVAISAMLLTNPLSALADGKSK